jgi:chemotaxis protein CheZ
MQLYAPWVAAMTQALAAGDSEGFAAALAGFDSARHCELTMHVRRVASGLQDALERFRVDSRLIDLAQRQVPDARHRLAHVLQLTDDAAHRTMDLVEQCCPLADNIAEQAEHLLNLQHAVASPAAASPNTLQGQFEAFLKQAGTSMAAMRSNLSEVLLAQGYQDLGGQIIRGVMALVDELELALADLVRIAGADSHEGVGVGVGVGVGLGVGAGAGVAGRSGADASSGSLTRGYGPAVPGIDHGLAVSGQADVDALLSDLGI